MPAREETLQRIEAFASLSTGDLTGGTTAKTISSERWDAVNERPLRGDDGAPQVAALSDDDAARGEVVFAAADAAFLASNEIGLQARATGYESDADVWAAMARGEPVAVVSAAAIGGGDNWSLPSSVSFLAERLPETTILVGVGDRTVEVVVIGVVRETVTAVTFGGDGFNQTPTVIVADRTGTRSSTSRS